MTWIQNAVEALRVHDAERPRSTQKAVGWSEAGGCRAAIGYRLAGAWPTDEPDTWAAQRGTAIHEYAGPVLAEAMGCRYEVETMYRGIPGHADLVGRDDDVTDMKTTTLANSNLWINDHDLLWAKRVQVHGYAAGLVDAGELTEDATVRLLVIPVDGTYEDWWAYEEPFDRRIADAGADRVEHVQAQLDAGQKPERDKPYAWCEQWCPFFSLCREDTDPREPTEITDPELAAAVARYGEAHIVYSQAKQAKEELAGLIRGLHGTAYGWRVSLGKPGAAKAVLDEEAVRADYAARGVPVPEVEKPGSAPRLSVTRQKPKAVRGARTVRPKQESKGPKAA